MKVNYISVNEAIANKSFQLIDVRSPKEYVESSIPSAINIPILDDQERELVGTIYRQVNPSEATQTGISLVTPKIPQLISKVKNLNQKDLVLYCWRGGLRSQSFAQICYEHGISVYVLKGGYKAYRRHVNAFWNSPFLPKAAVLHGLTGVGKTQLLNNLKKCNLSGIIIIDLEGIANNRGSVFGQVHGGIQPSQKNFEAKLFNVCKDLTDKDIVVVECESRRIGNIHLPQNFFQAMITGVKIHLYTDLKTRVNRIITDYGMVSYGLLKEKIALLTRFLGKNKIEVINYYLAQGDYQNVVRFLLTEYYDPLYGYLTVQDTSFDLSIDCTELENAINKLLNFLQNK